MKEKKGNETNNTNVKLILHPRLITPNYASVGLISDGTRETRMHNIYIKASSYLKIDSLLGRGRFNSFAGIYNRYIYSSSVKKVRLDCFGVSLYWTGVVGRPWGE